ncbi:MAG: hypothetical protein FJ267_07880, partial [Planctomycetes bacterium]|nr:hypothetical protein [Planctomycetota bacterium]
MGLGLVILMLLMLGIAGVSGMLAYRACVHDLRQMEAAPSRTDLALACAGLIEPLFLNAPADLEHREVRAVQPLLTLNQSLWAERLKKLNQQLNKFRNRLAKGYNEHRTLQVTQSYPIIMGKLDQIQRTLTGLEIRRGAYLVEPPDQKQVILDLMLQDVSLLQTLVQEIPSAERSLGEILVDADTAYRWRIWVIGICSVVVIGLLIGLFRCGYSWIFVPIRRLHDVASRVANGD